MEKYEKYPIFFYDGTCPACGEKDSLIEINKFGNQNRNNSLYPTSFIACKKCRRDFFIRWEKTDNDFNVPVAISRTDNIDTFLITVRDDLSSTIEQTV